MDVRPQILRALRATDLTRHELAQRLGCTPHEVRTAVGALAERGDVTERALDGRGERRIGLTMQGRERLAKGEE